MSDRGPESSTSTADQQYEPPRVTVLGTVGELTMAVGVPGAIDQQIFSIASDRALKHGIQPVACAVVLDSISTLALAG